MSLSQIKRIEKALANFASLATIQQKQKKFKSVNLTVSRVINKIEMVKLQLQMRMSEEGKYDAAVSETKTQEAKQAKKMQLAHTDKTEKQLREQLKELLVTGYEILMIIRQAITNQSIQYNFLVQTGVNSFISTQTELRYQQLLKMVSLEGVHDGKYQLRFKNLISFVENSVNKIDYEYENFVENDPSTAFSAFYRFFTDQRLHKLHKLNNFGTFAQAYHYWYDSHGNTQIPSNQQILEAFRYAKSGGGTGGAFYRGGDVGRVSNKAQSLSQAGNPGRPALTQLSAIQNGLLEVREGIKTFISEDKGTLQQLQRTFSTHRYGQLIQNSASQVAQETVFKQLSSVK